MSNRRREASPRPFRLWDSVRKKDVRYRYYTDDVRAKNAALLIVRWEQVGRTIEVYDKRTMRMLSTYQRKLHTISYTGA